MGKKRLSTLSLQSLRDTSCGTLKYGVPPPLFLAGHTHALLSSVSSQHFNFMFCLSCLNYFCCNVSEAFFRKMLPLLFMCNSKKSLSLPRLKVKINTSQTKKGTANKVTQKKQDPRLGQCN